MSTEQTAAPAERPPLTLELDWNGELVFSARTAHTTTVLDSDGKAGPSPTQALAFAIAACMGMDVVHFLNKSRVPASACRIAFSGRRAAGHPGRFVAIDLHFAIDSQASDAVVERAIELSRTTYCSVWNSMNPDIDFRTTFEINRG